jgi:hypothetical protein
VSLAIALPAFACASGGDVPARFWVQPEEQGARYQAVGVVQGKDGAGGGLYGYLGTSEAAVFKLRKAASISRRTTSTSTLSPGRGFAGSVVGTS